MMPHLNPLQLRQQWPPPSRPLPIVIIGAGGIVSDAHLPAYRKAGLEVAGIYDVVRARAEALAEQFDIPNVCDTPDQALRQEGVVFDVAVPPAHAFDVVAALPAGSAVLMQKPMGVDLADARRIREVCHEHKLTAAVNFQLRFSPMMLALRDAVDRGLLGDLLDVEFRLNASTPWELFEFLKKQERVEIQVHTVHYLDLIRSLLGEPAGVYTRTIGHPDYPELMQTRSSIILDYGQMTRGTLSINHNYKFGPKHETATAFFQGTRGAAVVTLGLLLNYPEGKPETLELVTNNGEGWQNIPIDGRWFPDGFIGTMSNLQRFVAGEDERLASSVEDAYQTMAVVEACYQSNDSGATPIPG